MPDRVIVVGGGPAGLAAAISAAEAGGRVTLLEKQDRLGGMLHWATGQFSAAGTRRQRAAGIADSADAHFDDVMRIGNGRNNPVLVRAAVDAAADAVDWLDDLGFPFAPGTPALASNHELYRTPRTYWGTARPNAGPDIWRTLERRLRELGDRVDVRLSTRVTGLLVAGRRVVGVATVPHGELRADTVVLATGGYAADRALLAEFQPSTAAAITGCLPHATGDGHRMLQALGIPITNRDVAALTMGLIEDPDHPGFAISLYELRIRISALERRPWEIWVTRAGRRFVNEDTRLPAEREDALRDQPRQEMFIVFDDAALTAAPPLIDGLDAEGIRRAAAAGRWAWAGSSLGEVAARAGIAPTELQAEVGAYNANLAGPDAFGREHRPAPIATPPFYAVRSVGAVILSKAGVAVDADLRPVDRTGVPLEGAFAVGELVGLANFSGDGYASGMSIGSSLALGRRLGLRLGRLSAPPERRSVDALG